MEYINDRYDDEYDLYEEKLLNEYLYDTDEEDEEFIQFMRQLDKDLY